MLPELLDKLWFTAGAASVRSAAAAAADLLAPTWCIGCRTGGTDLCPGCRGDLRLLTRHPFRAEEPAEALPILPDLSLLPVLSAAEYTTLVADAVLAFKDHQRTGLAHVLAGALGRALNAAAQHCRSGRILVVWPPTAPRSQLTRGRHPLGELIDLVVLPPDATAAGSLVRHRVAASELLGIGTGQKSRSQRARRRAESRFRLADGAGGQLQGVQVVLVDDVLTTGATLGSLYRLLSGAGADVRAAAVLAATPR